MSAFVWHVASGHAIPGKRTHTTGKRTHTGVGARTTKSNEQETGKAGKMGHVRAGHSREGWPPSACARISRMCGALGSLRGQGPTLSGWNGWDGWGGGRTFCDEDSKDDEPCWWGKRKRLVACSDGADSVERATERYDRRRWDRAATCGQGQRGKRGRTHM